CVQGRPQRCARCGAAYANKPTIPASAPMMVVLNRATPTAVDVTLTAGAGLTVPATVQIPANMTSVAIPVTGVTVSATPVTVTASLNGVMRSGTVRVLGDGKTVDVPTFTSVSPMNGKIPLAGMTTLTASLNLPAGDPVPLTITDNAAP